MSDGFIVCFAGFIAASMIHGVLCIMRAVRHASHTVGVEPQKTSYGVHRNEMVISKETCEKLHAAPPRETMSGHTIYGDEETITLYSSHSGIREVEAEFVVGRRKSSLQNVGLHKCLYCGTEHKEMNCPNCGGL